MSPRAARDISSHSTQDRRIPGWRFQTGAAIEASPISYAVGGETIHAVSSGNALYSFALRSRRR